MAQPKLLTKEELEAEILALYEVAPSHARRIESHIAAQDEQLKELAAVKKFIQEETGIYTDKDGWLEFLAWRVNHNRKRLNIVRDYESAIDSFKNSLDKEEERASAEYNALWEKLRGPLKL